MGNITISDSVISEIAYRTICQIYGVEPENKEFKKNKKNIQIDRTPEDHVVITIKLEVPYGENIVEFSKNIMKNVAESVSQMTDKVVDAVNVAVVSVYEEKGE